MMKFLKNLLLVTQNIIMILLCLACFCAWFFTIFVSCIYPVWEPLVLFFTVPYLIINIALYMTYKDKFPEIVSLFTEEIRTF